jgi:hypothetical protein
MNPLTSKKLTAGDTAILRHIARYRLTVPEVVARLPESRQNTAAELDARLRRLEEFGFIASTWLYAQRKCFILTPKGTIRVRGSVADRDPHAPFSEATKIRRFAALTFCCLTSILRQRLTAAELADQVAGVNDSDADTPYYVTLDESPTRMGFLRVDLGGHGRWDRILTKCQQDVRDHANDPTWLPWIASNRFEVTLVTALPHKAERLHHALSQQEHPPPIPVRITAIPELLYLIAPPPA